MFSKDVVDEFFPPKIESDVSPTKLEKFIYRSSVGLFFVSLFAQLIEITNYDNTIYGTKLYWYSGIAGILLAIFITVLLKILYPSVYYESNRRYGVYFGLFLGLFLITSAVAGFINHAYSDSELVCKQYIIEKKGESHRKTSQYYIYLKIDNNSDERFTLTQSLHESIEVGEKIELCMFKGKLGFYYIRKFNKLQ